MRRGPPHQRKKPVLPPPGQPQRIYRVRHQSLCWIIQSMDWNTTLDFKIKMYLIYTIIWILNHKDMHKLRMQRNSFNWKSQTFDPVVNLYNTDWDNTSCNKNYMQQEIGQDICYRYRNIDIITWCFGLCNKYDSMKQFRRCQNYKQHMDQEINCRNDNCEIVDLVISKTRLDDLSAYPLSTGQGWEIPGLTQEWLTEQL